MRREYATDVTTGNPRVAYRETITRRAEFNYTHKKQTGGSGQYGRVAGYMEPAPDEHFVFENNIVGGKIPTQFIPSCEKGFKQSMPKGPKMEFPVTGIKVVINDDGGSALPDDFNLMLNSQPVTNGETIPVDPGTYTVTETLLPGYTFLVFSGDCDQNGVLTLAAGESKTCTLTNDDQKAGDYVIYLPLILK